MTDMKDRYPICPVCGQETMILYRDKKTCDIVGCDECLEEMDAWAILEDQYANELACAADLAYDIARGK